MLDLWLRGKNNTEDQYDQEYEYQVQVIQKASGHQLDPQSDFK